jgi:Domain of unknown function (DUF5020)
MYKSIKWLTMLIIIFNRLLCQNALCQDIQLHYDLRHTVDPAKNKKNYPEIYFEYFRSQDSVSGFIKGGSFLLKTEADFTGDRDNMGQVYMQVSKAIRCWKPPVLWNIQYSGGLGVTNPAQYSYYIFNTFSTGATYPVQWNGYFLTMVLDYQHTAYAKPSNDFIYTLYWWKGYWHYKLEFSGDFSVWTENKNQGDASTEGQQGKRFCFFAEPQCWLNLSESFSVGSKFNVYYHVLTTENYFQVYPTLAIKYKLE